MKKKTINIIEGESAVDLQVKINKFIKDIYEQEGVILTFGEFKIHNHPNKARSSFYQTLIISE